VFEHVIGALVHGSGYEWIASAGCSDRTIRRRVKEWADLRAGRAAARGRARRIWPDHRAGAGRPRRGRMYDQGTVRWGKAGPSPVDRREGGM